MTDERGGRYFREARFFLAGDRAVAQSHILEARSLLGYLRDQHSMGGPPILAKYATLSDGTQIKAVMMNGQYQAEIVSPGMQVIEGCTIYDGLYLRYVSGDAVVVRVEGGNLLIDPACFEPVWGPVYWPAASGEVYSATMTFAPPKYMTGDRKLINAAPAGTSVVTGSEIVRSNKAALSSLGAVYGCSRVGEGFVVIHQTVDNRWVAYYYPDGGSPSFLAMTDVIAAFSGASNMRSFWFKFSPNGLMAVNATPSAPELPLYPYLITLTITPTAGAPTAAFAQKQIAYSVANYTMPPSASATMCTSVDDTGPFVLYGEPTESAIGLYYLDTSGATVVLGAPRQSVANTPGAYGIGGTWESQGAWFVLWYVPDSGGPPTYRVVTPSLDVSLPAVDGDPILGSVLAVNDTDFLMFFEPHTATAIGPYAFAGARGVVLLCSKVGADPHTLTDVTARFPAFGHAGTYMSYEDLGPYTTFAYIEGVE